MFIVGEIAPGKMGNLNEPQAVTWLEAKDSRKYNKVLQGRLNSCVGGVMADPGGTGGGNTRYTFQGKALYHVSHGAGINDGVTLFYVKSGLTAKIVGMGYHVGAQTYQLTWVHHDWSAMRNESKITFDR